MTTYFPNTLPKEAEPWLVREFQRIAQALDEPTPVSAWDILYEAPDKPRNGQMAVAGNTWNPGYGQGPYMYVNGDWVPMFLAQLGLLESAVVACSDETTALTTGTAKRTFRIPYSAQLLAVRSSVNTAPTGSTLVVDINKNASSILSTKLSIDASEKTSYTAATPAVISTASLAIDDEITIDIDQVGSTVAGAGLKVTFIWKKVP